MPEGLTRADLKRDYREITDVTKLQNLIAHYKDENAQRRIELRGYTESMGHFAPNQTEWLLETFKMGQSDPVEMAKRLIKAGAAVMSDKFEPWMVANYASFREATQSRDELGDDNMSDNDAAASGGMGGIPSSAGSSQPAAQGNQNQPVTMATLNQFANYMRDQMAEQVKAAISEAFQSNTQEQRQQQESQQFAAKLSELGYPIDPSDPNAWRTSMLVAISDAETEGDLDKAHALVLQRAPMAPTDQIPGTSQPSEELPLPKVPPTAQAGTGVPNVQQVEEPVGRPTGDMWDKAVTRARERFDGAGATL